MQEEVQGASSGISSEEEGTSSCQEEHCGMSQLCIDETHQQIAGDEIITGTMNGVLHGDLVATR